MSPIGIPVAFMQFAAEEVSDRGELFDGLGRADVPLAVKVFLPLLSSDLGNGDQADAGIIWP